MARPSVSCYLDAQSRLAAHHSFQGANLAIGPHGDNVPFFSIAKEGLKGHRRDVV